MNLKMFSGTLAADTAGLSPRNNERIELFFAGCKMARDGHPCPGCFNRDLWSDENSIEQSPQEIVDYISQYSDNKYVTIVGGEPLDQPEPLLELCKKLYDKDFHICLITHFLMEDIKIKHPDLLKNISMLIDGKYDNTKRIFDTDTRPGILHVVGSSNQQIYWRDKKDWRNITEEANLLPYYSKTTKWR